MPATDVDISRPRLIRDGSFLEADWNEIAQRRRPHNRLGFAYQIAFVRVLGRFPRQAPLEIDGEVLRFTALQLRLSPDMIHAYAERRQTVSEHQLYIRDYLGLRPFDATAADQLDQFLEGEALRLDRSGALFSRGRAWLQEQRILVPADYVLHRAVSPARRKARAALTDRMMACLSTSMRECLDALLVVSEDEPFSALGRIKTASPKASIAGMSGLVARLELIEDTGILEIDVNWINGNYQRFLFHSVRTASADRLREEMPAPRRYLALVCFLHQVWHDTLDQAVDMYGKLLERDQKQVHFRLEEKLKAQRHTVDRVVQHYQDLSAVLLDPDVDDAALRQRLLAAVPESDLRADQFALANWTRGDPKARFQETAQRHSVLSRFAEPFLTRMKFLDERHQGASPTLEALRVYREGRAAKRRILPADTPLDFAPKALEPLIRQNGQVDRRRWESALFLKVRDELRAGNLAIEGAKNFGRFEAFFLPTAEWEQVREDFWERTGFAAQPEQATEQLKDRLTAAFDRFLEGVSDNRQVAFDEKGWRLKTDQGEQLDSKRAQDLTAMRRWLSARTRSIRLADLLIEVENALAFSAHFHHPGERQMDAEETCALLPPSSPMAATSASSPWRRSLPISLTNTSSASVTGASSKTISGPPSPRLWTAFPAWMLPATGEKAGRRPATDNALPCRTACCSEPTAPASMTSPWSSTPSSLTTTRRFTADPSNAPTATPPSFSTACCTTKATSISKSTTPTRTAIPRSTSLPSP